MRLFTASDPAPTLADWLRYFRTRRRLFGMWRARHFPKRRKAKRSVIWSLVSGLVGGQQRGPHKSPIAAVLGTGNAQVMQNAITQQQANLAYQQHVAGLMASQNAANNAYQNQAASYQNSLANSAMNQLAGLHGL